MTEPESSWRSLDERPTLSIVFPAYNEERRVGQLLAGLGAVAASGLPRLNFIEALIVDDGSVDGTVEKVATELPGSPWLRLLTDGTPNQGKGAATARGVAAARGELVLLADVDLAAPLVDVAKLHAALRDGADVAIGSRDVPGSVVTASRARKFMGRTFNYGVRRVTGLTFRDTQCGFKLMPATVGRRLLGERLLVAGYAFDVEMLLRARALGLCVAEVPIRWDQQPDSKLSPFPATMSMSRDVLRLARVHRQTDRRLGAEGRGG